MYLCLCNAITLNEAKKAAQNCRTPKELASKLGIGSDCGACLLGALQDLKNHIPLKKNQEKTCQFAQKAS
jgi:bacterioferritin-associated ferredoxin